MSDDPVAWILVVPGRVGRGHAFFGVAPRVATTPAHVVRGLPWRWAVAWRRRLEQFGLGVRRAYCPGGGAESESRALRSARLLREALFRASPWGSDAGSF